MTGRSSSSSAPPAALLEAIIQSIEDAIVTVDERHRVAFLNPAAGRVFGADSAEMLHQPASRLPALADALRQIDINGAFADPNPRRDVYRLQVRLPGREALSMEATVAVARTASGPLCTLVLRDISQQQHVEKALFQSQKTLAIGSLASGVAHDFNNILTAVLSHIDLAALSPELPPALQEPLKRAKTSARRGAELVGKLLTFSRQSEPRMAVLNLADLAEEVVFMLRRSIDKRIHISLSRETDDLWPALGDASQLMQAMLNLCLNARDCMPTGGELGIRLGNASFPESAAIPPRKAGDFARLSVSDTGEGIPQDLINRVFEAYFTTKTLGKGAGLGLSIAQSLVVDHGGWIEAQSVVGMGSEFHVYLPRAKGSAESVERPAELLPAQSEALEGKETVLIVDDEEVVRMVIRAILSYRGYRIIESPNGRDAIEKCQSFSPPFDLVLLDLNMPRLNGWDTMEQLLKVRPRLPVILLSGGPVEGMEEKAVSAGAAALMPKPFENIDLLRLVRTTLDNAKGAGEAPSPAT